MMMGPILLRPFLAHIVLHVNFLSSRVNEVCVAAQASCYQTHIKSFSLFLIYLSERERGRRRSRKKTYLERIYLFLLRSTTPCHTFTNKKCCLKIKYWKLI